MAAIVAFGEIPSAPETSPVRSVKADDAALPTEMKAGINCADFDEIKVIGTLLNSATAATVTLYYWSPSKSGTPNGGFVPPETAQTLTIGASGQLKIFRVGHHKSVWLNVSGITGGVATDERVRLEVAGIPVYGHRG